MRCISVQSDPRRHLAELGRRQRPLGRIAEDGEDRWGCHRHPAEHRGALSTFIAGNITSIVRAITSGGTFCFSVLCTSSRSSSLTAAQSAGMTWRSSNNWCSRYIAVKLPELEIQAVRDAATIGRRRLGQTSGEDTQSEHAALDGVVLPLDGEAEFRRVLGDERLDVVVLVVVVHLQEVDEGVAAVDECAHAVSSSTSSEPASIVVWNIA